MRRLLVILTVALACLFGLPATAHAAPNPLGGGAVLFDPLGTARCTAAFAAVNGPSGYLITGRGCSGFTKLYSGDMTLVGTVVAATPAYAVVHVTNTTDWELVPWIQTGTGRVVIRGSVPTPVGGPVCVIDPVVGYHCGSVVATNQTIIFPEGTISGLTRTNVCASPRAVAFVTGDQAQGVPVAASGNCGIGGNSWFMPVNRILRTYGLTLLTG